MCDCYGDQCAICRVGIFMHLADFKTTSDEIRVYCEEHVPEKGRGILWEYWNEGEEANRQRCFVESLTDNAWNHREGNHPNFNNAEILREVPQEREGK